MTHKDFTLIPSLNTGFVKLKVDAVGFAMWQDFFEYKLSFEIYLTLKNYQRRIKKGNRFLILQNYFLAFLNFCCRFIEFCIRFGNKTACSCLLIW